MGNLLSINEPDLSPSLSDTSFWIDIFSFESTGSMDLFITDQTDSLKLHFANSSANISKLIWGVFISTISLNSHSSS